MDIAKDLYNYKSFNENNFKVELIGVNFLDTIKSEKIYYQPNFSNINDDKVEFTKKVVKEVYPNELNKSIINMIDHYSGVMLDLSAKKHCGRNSIRFNIRCPHKAYQNESIEKTIKDVGFDFSWKYINNVIHGMNQYKNQRYDSLFIVGFSMENEIITSIKYYFSIFDDEIVEDYNNFQKYHADDEDYFYRIMNILNISQSNVQELKKTFNIMNKHKEYIAFIGIDFDLNGNKFYKIYYKINEDYSFISDLCNTIELSEDINNDITAYLKRNTEKMKKLEYVAIAFSKDSVLQYQLYFGERM